MLSGVSPVPGLAEPELIAKLNQEIVAGKVQNRGGAQVQQPIDGGLIRADRQYLYPVRGEIPVLLIDEAIRLKLKRSAICRVSLPG